MVFSTQSFLFFFLPIFLCIYFLLPAKSSQGFRNHWLLVCSLFFYGWYEWKYLPLLAGITFICLLTGRYIEKSGRYRKSAAAAAAIICTGILVICKYPALSSGSSDVPLWIKEFVLPLGISFYTFQALSYVFDAYSGKNGMYPSPSYISFLTGTSMFTQLVAGPIIRWNALAPQLAKRKYSWENFSCGVFLFMAGFVKKILLADELCKTADPVFNASSPGTAAAWLGITAYTLQIYFDFSGYCDMGTGIARMTGFILPQNFRSPYRQCSVRYFWRHWHITLSRWFRDYLYIPAGGSRKGMLRTFCNIFMVMLLSGIWHGAGLNFIIFGLIHGSAIALEKIKKLFFPENIRSKFAGWSWMMITVMTSFVFFRTETPEKAIKYIGYMAGVNKTDDTWLPLLNNILSIKSAAVLIIGIFIAIFIKTTAAAAARKGKGVYCTAIMIFFAVSVLKMLGGPGKEFIYFIF